MSTRHEVALRLTYAVQDFRNLPRLGKRKHRKLRRSREYRELCLAWEEAFEQFGGVAHAQRLEDADLGTRREIERLEDCLRYIGQNCEDAEMVRHNVSRALRGKSIP